MARLVTLLPEPDSRDEPHDLARRQSQVQSVDGVHGAGQGPK